MKPLATSSLLHGYNRITEDIYNAANRDQAEFVCGLCQHDLQPRHNTEFIIEDLPGQFPDFDIPDEAVSFRRRTTHIH